MHSIIINRARNFTTLVIGLAEILMALLATKGHLNVTVESTSQTMTLAVNESFWSGAFLISGLLVLVAFKIPTVKAVSMSFAAAVLIVWGIIEQIYMFGTVRPVSWVGAILAVALGVIAVGMANIWSVVHWTDKVNEVSEVT